MGNSGKSVPVQKGQIISNPPTMKGTPRPVKDHVDMVERTERKKGQMLEFTYPKNGKK